MSVCQVCVCGYLVYRAHRLVDSGCLRSFTRCIIIADFIGSIDIIIIIIILITTTIAFTFRIIIVNIVIIGVALFIVYCSRGRCCRRSILIFNIVVFLID